MAARKKKPAGKKTTSWSPVVEEALEKSLQLGNTVEHSCAIANISKDTYYVRMRRGRADDKAGSKTSDATFFRRMRAAQSYITVHNLEILRRAAEGREVDSEKIVEKLDGFGNVIERVITKSKKWDYSVQAATWVLERRFPKDFGWRGVRDESDVDPNADNSDEGKARRIREFLAGADEATSPDDVKPKIQKKRNPE